jgi:hypothetical protein
MAGRTEVSPYLTNAHRLADVLAAIQAMGTYKFYKLDFEGWADRIAGDKTTADQWRQIIIEHPEFFRLDSAKQKASLIWRRQYPKRFDVDSERTLTRQEYENVAPERRERISRVPLAASDIQSLMQAAIDLHARALEQQRERRWWIPLLASGVGGLLGAIVGAAFGWSK